MYIAMKVPECDFDMEHFDKPVEGAGAVARGATGRWCVVMYAGPDYLKRTGVEVITPAEARAIIDAKEGTDYADF